jgi:hypothetical protein
MMSVQVRLFERVDWMRGVLVMYQQPLQGYHRTVRRTSLPQSIFLSGVDFSLLALICC